MKNLSLAFGFVFALALVSCSTENPWPSGSVEVLRSIDYVEGTVKYAAIQYSVTNSGTSMISASSVGFMVSTNRISYSATFRKELTILPGNTVYLQASIPYYLNTEVMSPNSVLVLDSFFE